MDSALRRQFLQILDADHRRVEMASDPTYGRFVSSPAGYYWWPFVRKSWRGE